LLEAKLTDGSDDIMMAVRSGKSIRFNESAIRPMGRGASGVRGVKLADEKDEVVGAITIKPGEADVLVVSEKGYGKRSDLEEYRITNRGGKGVKTINITEKTGDLIAIKAVTDDNDLIIINKRGITIRMSVSSMRLMGRNTQGVRLITLKDNDAIASVARVPAAEPEVEETPTDETQSPDSGKVIGNDSTETPENNIADESNSNE
jgi:DNA gyrase subunit A